MVASLARQDLDSVVLVLSHEMSADAKPTERSQLRLARAVAALREHPDALLVTSGWGYRDDTDATLADAMANAAIRDHGVAEQRIIRLHRSRDTVGDAVYFGLVLSPRLLIVITSSYHRDRTEQIFRCVLGHDVALQVLGVGEPASAQQRTAEARSLEAFRQTFKGIAPGDLAAFESRMLAAHPLYNGAMDAKAWRRHD